MHDSLRIWPRHQRDASQRRFLLGCFSCGVDVGAQFEAKQHIGIELCDRIDTRKNDTRFCLRARSPVPRFEWAFCALDGSLR